jgi:hypothetical protein
VTVPAVESVFINVPFDTAYEPLFVTLVGTLVFLGRQPRCVLEVQEQGDGRLARIYELMRTCRMSIHDMSRIGTPVRFNMPFELGLACGLKLADPKAFEVTVLDAKPYRMDRLFSDYKGRDPLIHNGTSDGMVASLLDLFQTPVANAATEFRRAIALLQESAELMKAELKSNTLFRPALFRSLVVMANAIAKAQGLIEP